MTRTLATTAALALLAGGAFAATDTIDATNGGPGTFFVPTLGQELDDPFYRDADEDWGWMHNPLAGGFTSASLNISAYDVDEAPCSPLPDIECEVDDIYVMDGATEILLGSLTGDNNAFSFTEFVLPASVFDDIETGLKVRMDIDATNTGNWLVSLSKSVITTDGANPGNPNPPAIPLPAAGWGLVAGIGALAALRRRRSAAKA